jgi:uncharacterized LabA/DUF88 family protein
VDKSRTCRVIVFIDASNVYRDLRKAFCEGSPVPDEGGEPIQLKSQAGQFDPARMGRLLASMGPDFETWTLEEVRIYCGRPSPDRERYATQAFDRQEAAWSAQGVVVRPRPLQYPEGWPTQKAHQKGVDVELAIDVVTMAGIRYDVGILASTDTDLVPALEAVDKVRGQNATPRNCVVGFDGLKKQLRLKMRSIYSLRTTRTPKPTWARRSEFIRPARCVQIVRGELVAVVASRA